MPLSTLDSSLPSFFRQGTSALTRLILLSLLAVFLMLSDTRWQLAQPVRLVLSTLLYPLQWVVIEPVQWFHRGSQYLQDLNSSKASEAIAQRKLGLQSLRANRVEQLELENDRLRQLLGLVERLNTPAQAAQVIYDVADPYTRKVVIDKGMVNHIMLGSPVLDEAGVLGHVTQVYAMTSEVTLVTDRDQAIPVLNTRTGARSLAFGDTASHGTTIELRFVEANADIKTGDLLSTSGVDGVYPAGLLVAKVSQVTRRSDSAFARVTCSPLALVSGTQHVVVLKPIGQIPPRPNPANPANPTSPSAKQRGAQ